MTAADASGAGAKPVAQKPAARPAPPQAAAREPAKQAASRQVDERAARKTEASPQGSRFGLGGAVTIIRLRGTQNLNPRTKQTLRYMRLNRINHAVVLPADETTAGMLQVAKDYVTWGEVDAATLANVIKGRGRLVGDQPLTDAHVAKTTPFKTIGDLAAAIVAGKFAYRDIPSVKPIFRLHPAKKGLEGIKRSVENGGALGYRGKEINELLGRMT